MENPIIERINNCITVTRRKREFNKMEVYKLIKAKLLEFITQKNAPELNEKSFISIIKKMNKEVLEDMDRAKNVNRLDLVEQCEYESYVLEQLLPKEATKEEINNLLNQIIPNGITQKEMGKVIKSIKDNFESVDGALVATLVKERIN